MATTESVHQQRDRAESFGAVAARYDEFRPGYPAELMEDLAELAEGGPVLDIGTGTGKAARLLVERGVDLLGIEVDPLMAEVARGHGLDVEVSPFESWADSGRTFTLITAAQAWHWVDPVPGAPKVARLLRKGGSFVPFWNFETVDDDAVTDVVDRVYRQWAPEIEIRSGSRSRGRDGGPYVADLQASGAFSTITTRTISWTSSYPVEHWLGRVSTHSDHLALGEARLTGLLDVLRVELGALGTHVHTSGGTYVIRAEVA